jgi:hypothetical protein
MPTVAEADKAIDLLRTSWILAASRETQVVLPQALPTREPGEVGSL